MEHERASRNRSDRIILLLLFLAYPVFRMSAKTWYVDGKASGSNDGTSWVDAWTKPASMRGLSPGDAVYFSGGPSGETQLYDIGGKYGQFTDLPGYANGTLGHPITYQIGQDAAHNGTAIFQSTVGKVASGLMFEPSNIIFSGNAGDGQMHFSVSNLGFIFNFAGSTNVTLSYLNAGHIGTFGDANGANGIHIDHCYAYIDARNADHATYANLSGKIYADNSIDHCTIYVPHQKGNPGSGADALQWNGSGFTISNNLIVGYAIASYAGGQHQDGEQATGAAMVVINGNRFLDIGNYAVYGDAYYGPMSDFHVYKNLVMVSDATVTAGSPGGIVIGRDGGYIGTNPCVFSDVTIINNTIVDYNSADQTDGIALNNVTNHPAVFENCVIANNAFVNSGKGMSLEGNSTTKPTHNLWLTARQARADFDSYVTFGGLSNDLHLSSVAVSLIGKGTDESIHFAKVNRTLIGELPWNIGAFGLQSPNQSPH